MTLQTLTKQEYEEPKFQFDFAGKMADGATLSSIVSVAFVNRGDVDGSDDITISGTTISGTYLQASYIGGTTGETYKITARVIDSEGQKLEMDGLLLVLNE